MAKRVLLSHFIDGYKRKFARPRWLTLDVDTTDDPTHGQQELAFFNGYYRTYCYQHLLIHTAEGDLLHASLLPGKGDVREAALSALQIVISKLRDAFPGLEIRVRADNGFACPALYDYCEDQRIVYVVNAGTHQKMVAETEELQERAVQLFEIFDEKVPVKVYGEFQYQAKTWRTPRRIIAKAAHTLIGPDERLLVTNSRLAPVDVYDFYAGRGQEENWIKDLKRDLRSDRLSCSAFNANELRLLLFACAYQLLHELRRRAPIQLRRLRLETVRLRFLRVAATVECSVRRLWVRISAAYPWRDDWLRPLPVRSAPQSAEVAAVPETIGLWLRPVAPPHSKIPSSRALSPQVSPDDLLMRPDPPQPSPNRLSHPPRAPDLGPRELSGLAATVSPVSARSRDAPAGVDRRSPEP